MSTAEQIKSHTDNITMTGRALDLLGCFQNGFDEIVQQLAEEYAVERYGSNSKAVIQVEVDDVRKAGEKVIEVVRTLVAQNRLSAGMLDKISAMGDCLSCK